MAITHRAVGAESADNSTNVDVAFPAGIQADDVLIACCHVSDQNAMSMSGDWTEIVQANGGAGSSSRLAAWFHVYDGSNLPSGTVTHAAGGQVMAGMAAYAGVDTADPIDAVGTVSEGNSGSVDFNAVTVATDQAWLLAIFGVADDNNYTPVGGWTVRFDDGGTGTNNAYRAAGGAPDGSVGLFDKGPVGTGSSGTLSITQSAADRWTAVLVALKPAGASGGGGNRRRRFFLTA